MTAALFVRVGLGALWALGGMATLAMAFWLDKLAEARLASLVGDGRNALAALSMGNNALLVLLLVFVASICLARAVVVGRAN